MGAVGAPIDRCGPLDGLGAQPVTTIEEAQLARLERSGRAAWVWDPGIARIVWATPAAARLWRSPSVLSLIDRPFGRLDPARTDMAHVAEAVGDGGRVEARIRFWASDGRHSAAVEGRKWPLEGGGDGVLFQLDTAPRRRAAQAPLPSEAPDEIDALLGPFPLPIALFSPRGPCVYANAAFEDCLGAARGPSLTELAGSARGAARLIRAVLNGRTLRISPTLRWKGKEMSFVMDAARVTDPRTEREAVLVQLENVDARRAQERRLQDGLRTARTLLESVIEGWISLDGQRRMTAFGGRGLAPFRARLDLSLGRPWRDVQQVLGLRKDAAAQEAAERALQPGTDRFVRLSGETDARLLRTRVRRRRSADGRTDGYHILFQSAEDLLPMLAAASLREAPATPESPAPIAAPLRRTSSAAPLRAADRSTRAVDPVADTADRP